MSAARYTRKTEARDDEPPETRRSASWNDVASYMRKKKRFQEAFNKWAPQCMRVSFIMFLCIVGALAMSVKEPDAPCSVSQIHGLIAGMTGSLTSSSEGVTVELPKEAMLVLGISVLSIGLLALWLGADFAKYLVSLVLAGALALAAEEFLISKLMAWFVKDHLLLDLTVRSINRDDESTTLGETTLDMSCASEVLAVAAAGFVGYYFATYLYRGALFFYGLASAVMFMRLISQFYPWLITPIGDPRLFGYPLLPFWGLTFPLGFLSGSWLACHPDASMVPREAEADGGMPKPPDFLLVTVTAFFGAVATDKGARTLVDFFFSGGESTIDFAGGDTALTSDFGRGVVQLVLFAIGIIWHFIRQPHGSVMM